MIGRDNRTVTFTDNTTYTITPVAEDGGTVSGGGTVLDGESITLTATADGTSIYLKDGMGILLTDGMKNIQRFVTRQNL